MLIGGTPVRLEDSTSSIRELCCNLPSSFPAFSPVHPDSTKRPPHSVIESRDAGKSAYDQGNYEGAIKHYSEALSHSDGNKVTDGYCHHMLGDCERRTGNIQKASEHFKQAAALLVETRSYTELSTNAEHEVALHRTQGTLNAFMPHHNQALQREVPLRGTDNYNQNQEILARKYLAAEAESSGKIPEARQHLAELYQLEQGPMVKDVANVEEREVGFSDSMKLGTSNIQQCMVIIVRDPLTYKTAMAHFNSTTAPSSVQEDVLDHFPPNTALEVRLIGSREHAGKETSESNIDNVMSVLKKHERLTVISSDIWKPNSPTAVICNPRDGSIEYGVPIDSHPAHTLNKGVVAYRIAPEETNQYDLRLNYAFDMTKGSLERKPLQLNKASMQTLRNNDSKTADQSYNDFVASVPDQPPEWYAHGNAAISAIAEANKHQTTALSLETARQMKQHAFPIPTKIASDQLLYEPKHIGEGAEGANHALIEATIQKWTDKYTELTQSDSKAPLKLDVLALQMLKHHDEKTTEEMKHNIPQSPESLRLTALSEANKQETARLTDRITKGARQQKFPAHLNEARLSDTLLNHPKDVGPGANNQYIIESSINAATQENIRLLWGIEAQLPADTNVNNEKLFTAISAIKKHPGYNVPENTPLIDIISDTNAPYLYSKTTMGVKDTLNRITSWFKYQTHLSVNAAAIHEIALPEPSKAPPEAPSKQENIPAPLEAPPLPAKAAPGDNSHVAALQAQRAREHSERSTSGRG